MSQKWHCILRLDRHNSSLPGSSAYCDYLNNLNVCPCQFLWSTVSKNTNFEEYIWIIVFTNNCTKHNLDIRLLCNKPGEFNNCQWINTSQLAPVRWREVVILKITLNQIHLISGCWLSIVKFQFIWNLF